MLANYFARTRAYFWVLEYFSKLVTFGSEGRFSSQYPALGSRRPMNARLENLSLGFTVGVLGLGFSALREASWNCSWWGLWLWESRGVQFGATGLEVLQQRCWEMEPMLWGGIVFATGTS